MVSNIVGSRKRGSKRPSLCLTSSTRWALRMPSGITMHSNCIQNLHCARTTLRPTTLAWLTQHHVEKHHDEIQALILRLDVRFDVSPLVQQRLEPLDDRARSLTLHALLLMDNDALVHTIEWLRSLSNEIWRVFVSPLGLAGLSTAEHVASYFVRLAHFTLSASLYRFLSTLGILEKQVHLCQRLDRSLNVCGRSCFCFCTRSVHSNMNSSSRASSSLQKDASTASAVCFRSTFRSRPTRA